MNLLYTSIYISPSITSLHYSCTTLLLCTLSTISSAATAAGRCRSCPRWSCSCRWDEPPRPWWGRWRSLCAPPPGWCRPCPGGSTGSASGTWCRARSRRSASPPSTWSAPGRGGLCAAGRRSRGKGWGGTISRWLPSGRLWARHTARLPWPGEPLPPSPAY